MIEAGNVFALWAVLIGIVAFGIWSERTRIGRRLTGTIVVLLSALFLSNIGVIPTSAPVYGTVMGNFIPLGLALLLLRVDLKTLRAEAGPTLTIFMIGARPGCFRPSDRLAGRDSHPLEIANFHGILVLRDVRQNA